MSEPTQDDFKYYAFISYSSKDKAVAKKLHKSLETYKIPKDLRGRPGRDGPVPTKIFPVFRDRDDLPLSSDLGGSIQGALRASRYLIVLASTNSSKSRWVNEEIRYFKALGRKNRILALILDGEPCDTENGNPENESFPKALRYHVTTDGQITDQPAEPIGGDLRKGGDGWKRSFLKAVAGITGLGFDAFARREAKRARRKRLALAAIALLTLGAGLWTWDYYRIKTTYYNHLTFKYGAPVGVGEISASDQAKRYRSFRFKSSKRKVREVAVVSSSGEKRTQDEPNSEYPAFSTIEFKYRENGDISSQNYKYADGRPFLELAFSDDLSSVERRQPGRTGASAASGNSTSLGSSGWAAALNNTYANATEISRFQLTFNDQGYLIEKKYLNSWGAPARDPDGALSVKIERDELGRITSQTSLDANGQPLASKISGVASHHLQYHENSLTSREDFRDADGELIDIRGEFSYMTVSYDPVGNITRRSFFKKDDTPGLRHNAHHQVRAYYDEQGNLTKQDYWLGGNIPGHVAPAEAHLIVYHNDDRGRTIGASDFDDRQKPLLGKTGYHKYLDVLSHNGLRLESRYYGTDGKPTLEKASNSHLLKYAYDENGFFTSISSFDKQEKPTLQTDGYQQVRYLNDQSGNILRESYFGIDLEPVRNKSRAHQIRNSLDHRGNITSTRYFDEQEKPVIASEGYHEFRREWNERGLQVSESYHDENLQPTTRRDWALHKLIYTYDQRGNRTSIKRLGQNLQPVTDESGVHETRQEWDPRGNLIATSYFGDRNQPVFFGQKTYHLLRYIRDSAGRITSKKFFDTNQKPTRNENAIHEIRFTFDPNGNQIHEAYFDSRANPTLSSNDNAHAIAFTRDSRGNITRQTYLDTQGKPTKNERMDTVHINSVFDRLGREIERNFTDEQNNLIPRIYGAVWEYKHNEAGKITKVATLDHHRRPFVPPNRTHAYEVSEFGKNNLLTAVSYFGKDNQPVLKKTDQYHRIEYDRDRFGQVTERRHYDTNLEPTYYRGNQYFMRKNAYDKFGKVIRERAFGKNGEPILQSTGIHEVRITYDTLGNVATLTYFGTNGEPVTDTSFAAHHVKKTYDRMGNDTQVQLFDTDRQPTLGKDGYHRRTSTFVAPRVLESIFYYGTSDQPIIHPTRKYHGFKNTHNERFQPLSTEYFDTQKQPINIPAGYAKIIQVRDDLGRVTRATSYDQNHKPLKRLNYQYIGTQTKPHKTTTLTAQEITTQDAREKS